ncbi:transcriptional antitermination N peptide [Salmonella bongori]|uniref:transcriptional antitermination N peptide n=1 Tax=Salmonella bongori TaxID=54736 RepID=UPI001ED5E870|nr:hypothetical protein [Salmonella bongori]MBA3224959.1 hypothetical protein [Salmonella bongori]
MEINKEQASEIIKLIEQALLDGFDDEILVSLGKHETPKRIEDAKSLQFMAKDAFWQLEEYRRNLERAAIVYANEFGHKPPETGVCLPDVALYAAGHRKCGQITAR